MATLVTEQGIIHYETYGRGRPVLLLHGWLGSWELWRPTVEELGKEFRLYAIDFWGFGDSANAHGDFSVPNFVSLVDQFMDRLGIVKAPLVGHSMGGTVALSVALLHPDKIVKVGVVGSPINGSSLSLALKVAGYEGWMSLSERSPRMFELFLSALKVSLRGYSYLLSKDGKRLGDMFQSDLSKLTYGPFFQSIRTLRQTDLRQSVGTLQMPILGIYGKRDLIVNPNQAQTLRQSNPRAKIGWYEDAGHFPMLDAPQRFHEQLREFLNNG